MATQEKKAPEPTFASLVLTLSTSAWVSLGKISDPAAEEVKKDFDGAKYIIDSLIMLREKTKGNLEDAEQKLLNGIISELQSVYAEAMFKQKEGLSDRKEEDTSTGKKKEEKEEKEEESS